MSAIFEQVNSLSIESTTITQRRILHVRAPPSVFFLYQDAFNSVYLLGVYWNEIRGHAQDFKDLFAFVSFY